MALKTQVPLEPPKKIEEGVQTLPAAPPKPTAIPIENTVVLELALYKNYNYRGTMYVKGTGYRFRREDAISLLNERDADRPIWRQFRVPRKVVPSEPVVVDVTNRKIEHIDEELPGSAEPKRTRIDVGDDSEIADLLPKDGIEEAEEVMV